MFKKGFISVTDAQQSGLAGILGTSCYPKSTRGGDSRQRSTGFLLGPGEMRILCPFGSWALCAASKGRHGTDSHRNPPEPEGGNGS